MKKILTLLAIVCCYAATAQTADVIKFNADSHQFGKIKQNVPVTYVFNFTNTGSAKPVVIEFANAECGCTTPEYSKDAVLKGKTGTVKVTYNAAAMGAFKKHVNVKFANIQQPVVLTIEGEVVPAKTEK